MGVAVGVRVEKSIVKAPGLVGALVGVLVIVGMLVGVDVANAGLAVGLAEAVAGTGSVGVTVGNVGPQAQMAQSRRMGRSQISFIGSSPVSRVRWQ